MGDVADYLRAWRAEIAPYGISQPFQTMDLSIIDRLEARLPGSEVAQALISSLNRRANSLRHITDFERWLPVYEEYAEAKVGLILLETNHPVIRIVPPRDPIIPPGQRRRPDFQIIINGTNYFIEVKTLHARGGSGNYRSSFEDSFEALVRLDERRGTRSIRIAETVVQPHRNPGDDEYDPRSNRQIIETLIGRAVEQIKVGQFNQGTTVLALELSLLPFRSSLRAELYRAYPDPHEDVASSGILWNLAFGEEGADIFRPVDFQGASNLDGRLEALGLLRGQDRTFVRGVLALSGRISVGWRRKVTRQRYQS